MRLLRNSRGPCKRSRLLSGVLFAFIIGQVDLSLRGGVLASIAAGVSKHVRMRLKP